MDVHAFFLRTRLRSYLTIGAGTIIIALLAATLDDVPAVTRIRTLISPLRWHMQYRAPVDVPMTDGETLRAELMLPLSEGPWPAILIRTPYNENNLGAGKFFTRHGYVVINQHTRGRYGSTGTFVPSMREGQDGFDTLTWITNQPWSNGKVGTYGCSYRGESQILLAKLNHTAHLAAIAQGAGGAIGSAGESYAYFGIYEHGVLTLASALGWFSHDGYKDVSGAPDISGQRVAAVITQLPVADLVGRLTDRTTDYRDFVTHNPGDDWWNKFGYITDKDRFSTPTLHATTWYDQTVDGTFKLAAAMRKHSAGDIAAPQSVLVGPGTHCVFDQSRVGELPVDDDGFDQRAYWLAWFDKWLKGKPGTFPAYRVFVLGANEWKDFRHWPPSGSVPMLLYLGGTHDDSASGSLNRSPGVPGAASYDYDPANPVPSLGGAICCTGNPNASGAIDQRPLEARTDILIYTSDVLDEPVRVIGDNRAILFAESNAADTDFTVKLIDVWPDGRAFNVQDSVMRARYRNGYLAPAPMRRGNTYRLSVELGPIAYEFKAGHRIRIHVSSSNFPRLARNLNTGADPRTGTAFRTATNTLHYGGHHASYLELRVVPGTSPRVKPDDYAYH